MKSKVNQTAFPFPLLLALGLWSVSANAAVILNGDLTGTPEIATTPPSWFATTLTPDLSGPGGVAEGSPYLYAPLAPASPNGGTFVIVQLDSVTSEGFGQNISGLIPGASYEISFFQSQVGVTSSGAPVFIDPAQWSVSFAGTTQLSPIATFDGVGSQTWNSVTLTGFTATQETELLSFTSYLTPGSSQGYLGIDGISIQQIPEPSSAILMVLVATAVAGCRRLRLM